MEAKLDRSMTGSIPRSYVGSAKQSANSKTRYPRDVNKFDEEEDMSQKI